MFNGKHNLIFSVPKENMKPTTPYTYNTELSSLAECFFFCYATTLPILNILK